MGRTVRRRNLTLKKKANGRKFQVRLENFQTFVGVLISIATAFIAWQTYTLSQRTQSNNDQLKAIEDQLSQTRFGFERVRDIYDRAEKYLSSSDQTEPRGRILVILISGIPDSEIRKELLSVVAEKAKLNSVAAKAADLVVATSSKAGTSNPGPAELSNSNFTGHFALSRDPDTYTYTTLEDFGFRDKRGKVWTVPKGFSSDASSVPRIFWTLTGAPLSSGNLAMAVFLHDYYYKVKTSPKAYVDLMFYECMMDLNVPANTAKTLYNATRFNSKEWNSPS